MFMSFGKSLGFGEIEGMEIYVKDMIRVKMWQLSAKLKFSLNDP